MKVGAKMRVGSRGASAIRVSGVRALTPALSQRERGNYGPRLDDRMPLATTRSARSVSPYRDGFTLIELMVVITVIAIVTAVMVTEMGGTYEDALLRANARKLIDVCDAASNRAIAAQQAQVLKIDSASGHFAVRAKARELDEKDAFLTEGDLDKRIRFMVREPARGDDVDESEQAEQETELGAVTFYPDGSADAREFTFRDRAGVELVLRINPTTSRVRIMEMAEQ